MTPQANSRMARATTNRRLLREKSTRRRIIRLSVSCAICRYLRLFERNHIGRWRMRARVFHNAHEAMRQLQYPFRLAEADRFIGDQLFADTDGAGSRRNV